jgi:outer membrane protein, multidrug efflux system
VLGNATPNDKTTTTFLADLGIAWELDLWGRIRRLDESAQALYLATLEARRGVTLSLIARVARGYFELRALDQLLEIARRTAASFESSLTLFNDRLAGGAASKLETARAEAALASTEATVPDIERLIQLKENELNALLGRNPGPIPRSGVWSDIQRHPRIPAGLPSSLMERRPDIRAAEQNLRSANAQVGAALGDMFPRIGLTSLFGGVSSELSTLTSGGNRAWSMGATVFGPIFQGNRLSGRYRQTQAARQEAELLYRQTALNAFHEVSNALLSREKLEAVRISEERAVAAYEQAVKVSIDRYRAGKSAYFEVLEAQQQLLPAENSLVRTQLDQQLAVVQLYLALGGGWSAP